MSLDQHVRALRREDLAAVLSLTHMVPEAPWWSEARVDEIISSQPNAGSTHFRRGWVAEAQTSQSNETVNGFIVISALRLPSEHAIECEVESIVVHPDYRRRGMGTRLLNAAVRWCHENRASILRLEVRSRNMSAIRLYLRSGFSAIGVRPAYYESPPDDALLMAMAPASAPQPNSFVLES